MGDLRKLLIKHPLRVNEEYHDKGATMNHMQQYNSMQVLTIIIAVLGGDRCVSSDKLSQGERLWALRMWDGLIMEE